MGYVFLITALVLNAAANVMMKLGSANLRFFKEFGLLQGLMRNHILLIGLFLFAANIIFYVLALSKMNLSLAYPVMMAGGVVIITGVSTLFLKETLNFWQLVGILFLVLGLVLLTSKS